MKNQIVTKVYNSHYEALENLASNIVSGIAQGKMPSRSGQNALMGKHSTLKGVSPEKMSEIRDMMRVKNLDKIGRESAWERT